MENIFFSIVIPAYNAQKYIGKTLNSILKQVVVWDDVEILIIDDGSKDETSYIVHKIIFENESVSIRYIYKENGGLGDARNFGIEHAKGEYVWFFDADDEMPENALDSILNKLKICDLDLLGFDVIENYVDKKKIKRVNFYNKPVDQIVSGKKFIMNFNLAFSACFFVIKKSILVKNKLFFLKDVLSEDFYFELRLLEKCQKISHINFCCYNYMIRNGSLSRRRNNEYYYFHHESMLRIIDELNKYFVDFSYKEIVNTYIARIKIIATINLLNSTIFYSDKVKYFYEFKNLGMFELGRVDLTKLGYKHIIMYFLIYFKMVWFVLYIKSILKRR
ncbi:glycosyltransferase family 2 protein [Acinetobacter indicus]|uniref:glycosyltransferase family 2 protein n=1 Tax=Acinetobacter indicus TaxID=756892 RepID=UPI000CEBA0B7|nr:glycosyltransferase family 2 protein [Acinetobacter indicus]